MDAFAQISDPVLVFAAHEDDIEIHAGGTLARLVAAGKVVSCVLATSGNRGTADPSKTMAEMAAIREAEQRAASSQLGVHDLTFLGFDDGDLQYEQRRLREAFVYWIRAKRPRAVISHDPYPGNGSHDACSIYPDHLTVGATAFEAAYVTAPGPLSYPEHLAQGLEPWKPESMYCMMSGGPDVFVDIAPVWERKWAAIREHRSQGRDAPGMEEFFRNIARELGQRAGVELAEAFRLIPPG